jgi:hypothetical protein
MNWGLGSRFYVAVRLLDVKVNNLLSLVLLFIYLLPCYLFLLLFLSLTFVCTNVFVIPRLVCTTRPHKQKIERVMGIGFQPGLDPAKVN